MNDLTTARAGYIARTLEAMVKLSNELLPPKTQPFGESHLAHTHLQILFVLSHSPQTVTPSWLAEVLQLTPGAITQAVNRLCDEGLVERMPAAHDKRVRILTLTDSARQLVESIETRVILRIAPWFAALSTDQLATLSELLSAVTGSGGVPVEAAVAVR